MRFGPLGPLTAALLIGCSGGSALAPGRATEADVRAAVGAPVETRRRADGETVLWYWGEIPIRAYGRGNYAARIAPDGWLISLEQRLNDANIAKLLPGVSRAEDVRDVLGPPHRFARQALKQQSRSGRREQWGELLIFLLRGSTYPPACSEWPAPDGSSRPMDSKENG